jgi:uncharacterized membrane protein
MLEFAINGAVRIIEVLSALMIVIVVVAGVVELARRLAQRDPQTTDARLRLGPRLVLALEFFIAADILKTVIAPTPHEVALLGGVILIRTVLSLSIAYELRRSPAE